MAEQRPVALAPVPRFRKAYATVLPEIRGLRKADCLTLNLDIASTVATVMGAWPKIRKLRDKLAKVPGFDLTKFDRLENYALALGHAQTRYQTAAAPPPPLTPLADKAINARQVLLFEVTLLVSRQLLPSSAIGELRGINGYLNVAFDLFLLSSVLKERWTNLSRRTTLTLSELDDAERLADELVSAVAERKQARKIPKDVIEERQAAFTLLVNAYHEIRTAVVYIRRKEGDADTIAPSLYQRNRRNKTHAAEGDHSFVTQSDPSALTPSQVARDTTPNARSSPDVVPSIESAPSSNHGPFLK